VEIDARIARQRLGQAPVEPRALQASASPRHEPDHSLIAYLSPRSPMAHHSCLATSAH
jgi:hypothetical protein